MGENTPYVVVVWGDSIAAGGGANAWPGIAERTCNLVTNTGRPVKLVNSAAGGMPAAQARREFAQRVLAHRPQLVLLQFGFNDLRHDGARGPLPISTAAEFAEHLEAMGRACRDQAGAAVVYFGNHRARLVLEMPDGRQYDAWRQQYNDVARAVAARLSAPYFDLAQELWLPGAAWTDLVCEDGVHLSPLGYHAYGRFAAQVIRQQMLAAPPSP